MNASCLRPIGVFDSGVGGYRAARHPPAITERIRALFWGPGTRTVWPRPLEEVRQFSESITRFLLERQAKLIVVACNTAQQLLYTPSGEIH